jgi:hypothetical protein
MRKTYVVGERLVIVALAGMLVLATCAMTSGPVPDVLCARSRVLGASVQPVASCAPKRE